MLQFYNFTAESDAARRAASKRKKTGSGLMLPAFGFGVFRRGLYGFRGAASANFGRENGWFR